MRGKELVWGTCLLLILGLAGGVWAQAGWRDGRPGVASMAQLNADWTIMAADSPKDFTTTSLALDADDQPHVAYGQDHLYYRWSDGSTWHTQTVDASYHVGAHNSLVLDAAGYPHISYCDESESDLKYAHWDGNAWIIEVVDNDGDVGYYTSLALDAAGHPHISYCQYRSMQWDYCQVLKYAHFDGTSWQIEAVDSGIYDIAGGFTSLALDGAGHPHISYCEYDIDGLFCESLKYAHHNGSAWQINVVDSTGLTGFWTALALDSTGYPHISYYDRDSQRLRYARYDAGGWDIETVDAKSGGWNQGGYTSLSVGSGDLAHISYCLWDEDSEICELRYARDDGVDWQIEPIGDAVHPGYYTSLELDTVGRPHVSYYAPSGGELHYAYHDGSAWQTVVLDESRVAGVYNSLALDTEGQSHIAYQRGTDLFYARYDGSAWQIAPVDQGGDKGQYATLALDVTGHPHIAYCARQEDACSLHYAYYDGSAWQLSTVDSAGDLGRDYGLAVDDAGHPHISYYDVTNTNLKYAYYDGGAWQVETVDSSGDMGRHNALAVDSAGHPHIVYLDQTGYLNARLKYAWHDGTAWQIQAATGSTNVGFYVSLALDADDQPHVAYCNEFNYRCDGLHYDYYDGTSWHRKVVAGGSETGYYTSLALDPEGYPAIGYLVNLSNASLRLARYNGSAWQIETVQGGLGYSRDVTLALDSRGRPHLSYHDSFLGSLMYAYQSCLAVRGASIDGPAFLPAGQPGQYGASPLPADATLPITFTWDNGSDGVTTTYSWDAVGTYTLTVTATNDCGWATGTLTVTVFCQSLEGTEIVGPEVLLVNQEGVYAAIPQPITASLPITFTWSNNTNGSTATYSWAMTGIYEIGVTATNPCGIERTASLQVQVLGACQYNVYVPLVLK